MPRHHRCRRPPVRHPWADLINPIPSSRVSQHVHLIGVDPVLHHEVLDQPVKQWSDVRLKPHVPTIRRRTGCDIVSLLRLVKLQLVAPLLVIDRGRGTPAAVQGNPKRATGLGGTSKNLLRVAQRIPIQRDFFCGNLLRTFPEQEALVPVPKRRQRLFGL